MDTSELYAAFTSSGAGRTKTSNEYGIIIDETETTPDPRLETAALDAEAQHLVGGDEVDARVELLRDHGGDGHHGEATVVELPQLHLHHLNLAPRSNVYAVHSSLV